MPNVLDRQFGADRPNQKSVADFTYLRTSLYLTGNCSGLSGYRVAIEGYAVGSRRHQSGDCLQQS